jgi:hypothetical protein
MKQPFPKSEQMAFDWPALDPEAIAPLAGECVDTLRSLPKGRTVVLISCSKEKKQSKDTACCRSGSPSRQISQLQGLG